MSYEMVIVDGEFEGLNYKFAPFIAVYENYKTDNQRFVLQVYLNSNAYGDFTESNNKKIAEAEIIVKALNG